MDTPMVPRRIRPTAGADSNACGGWPAGVICGIEDYCNANFPAACFVYFSTYIRRGGAAARRRRGISRRRRRIPGWRFRSGGIGGGGFRGIGGGGFRGFGGGGFRGRRISRRLPAGLAGDSGGFRGGFRGFGRSSFGFGGFLGSFYAPYYYSPFFYGDFGYGWLGYVNNSFDYYPSYNYAYPSNYAYPAYQSSYQPASQPNVVVVYPPQAERATPALHEYDEYGQEVRRPSTAPQAGQYTTPQSGAAADSSPLYLIAFHDDSIRVAIAYWVEGGTLHYVTREHEQKQAPLADVDRDLSARLNRERRVTFSLPAGK